MSERGTLLSTLERLFAGPPESVLTLDEFLLGLEGRSYALAVAALAFPNGLPTGIPWLSTVTGVPILIMLAQFGLHLRCRASSAAAACLGPSCRLSSIATAITSGASRTRSTRVTTGG